MKIGLYPGTFDPLTNGHLDIIVRSSTLCDKLIIAVAKNPSKNPFFSINKRIDLINEALLLNKIDTKLVSFKKNLIKEDTKNKLIIKKIILGPFKSELNPIGIMSPKFVSKKIYD